MTCDHPEMSTVRLADGATQRPSRTGRESVRVPALSTAARLLDARLQGKLGRVWMKGES
jgi:hypothetical protein